MYFQELDLGRFSGIADRRSPSSASASRLPGCREAGMGSTGEEEHPPCAVAARLPQLEFRQRRITWSTSSRRHRQGLRRSLLSRPSISLDDMVFVGDRLGAPTGTTTQVLAMGVACEAVEGWEDTVNALLKRMLAA